MQLPGTRPIRGERRTVTLLFADIEGSTAAAEQMDPEDWAEIINGAYQRLLAPVDRYGGTLARLQGDAVVAFFGAPAAHEDDPARAVRAGLDIVDAITAYAEEVRSRTHVSMAVRVGINTGLVVVGEVGSASHVEYTALGDAVNVAARMEQTASPNTVRVTDHTVRLLSGMFEVTDIGRVAVKGKAEPVRAFEVVGPFAGRAPHRSLGPLVGRGEQLTALVATVRSVLDGQGSIISLVGEAGMGKTRLLTELRRALEEDGLVVATRAADGPADISWLEGASRSYEAGVPYATFNGVLRRWWAVDGDTDDAWGRVTRAVARLEGTADDDTAALLATVGGVPPSESQRQWIAALETPALHERVTEAVIAHLEAEAARRPLVVVLDDLHWGDALSLALVERLQASTESSGIALVMAMRPGGDGVTARLIEAAARAHGGRWTPVVLVPLSEEATGELLDGLQGAELPTALRERIVKHADGNPLFVEQLVASWDAARDTPHDGPFDGPLHVPVSLTGLLTARLDQLGDAARRVAQVASVVGTEFDLAAVAAMSDDTADLTSALGELQRSGIVVARSSGGPPRYAFRHALMQEAAYGTTLLRRRRELHERLAGFLESTEPEAVEDIARHYVSAGARDRALPYLIRAGERATRSMALDEAVKLFTAAIQALPDVDDAALVVRAYDGLGEGYRLIPDLPEAASAYQRLREYGRSSALPGIEITALNRLGMATASGGGDLGEAQEILDEARRIAEDSGDDMALAETHLNSCLIASLQGDVEAALAHDLEVERLGTKQRSRELHSAGLMRRALNLLYTTRYEEGALVLHEAMEEAAAVGATHDAAVLRALGRSLLALRVGDHRRARDALVEELPSLERWESFYTGLAHAHVADIDLLLGDFAGALAAATKARRFAAVHGQPFTSGAAAACMAHVYARCGLTDQHDRLREEALHTLGPSRETYLASTVWLQLGSASAARGATAQASTDFREGLAVSSTRYWERPAILIGLVLVTAGTAAGRDAAASLDEVGTYVGDRGITAYDGDLAHARGRLAYVEGRLDEAHGHLEQATTAAARHGRRLLEYDVARLHFEVARRRGRRGDAERLAERIHALTQEMAALIVDGDVRRAFVLESRRVDPTAVV